MKTFRLLAAAAALAALTAPAAAQDFEGLYGFVYGGINFDTSIDADGTASGTTSSLDLEFDNGFTFGLGVGSQITPNYRVEVELLFADQDTDALSFSGSGPAADVTGDLTTTAVFANGFYDFANDTRFTPYLGAGIGVARVEQDVFFGTAGGRLNDQDTVFGAQLIAGVSYEVTERVSLTGDVRYRRLFDVDSDTIEGTNMGAFSGDLETVAVNIGVRISF